MRLSFACLALVLFASAGLAEQATRQDRIGFGWGGTIWGNSFWRIGVDDLVTYTGLDQGARADLPGWHWTDAAHRGGEAVFAVPGVYARSLAVARAALADPVLRHVPVSPSVCLDAGRDSFWLNPRVKEATIDVDGCYLTSFAEGGAGDAAMQRFGAHLKTLREDLLAAIGPLAVEPTP
jgi:hypothetical protein